MNNKKKIIILLIIVSLFALIILISLLGKQKKPKISETMDMNEDISNIKIVEKDIYFKDYKIIKNCVQKYIDILNIESSRYYGRNENNEYVKVTSEEEIKKNIYDYISKTYIEKNDITINNLYEYINVVKEKYMVIPTKIIRMGKDGEDTTVEQYNVSVLAIQSDNKSEFHYLYLKVNIDNEYSTFSIEPLASKNELEKLQIDNKLSKIEKTNNNIFSSVKSTQEEIALDYFSNLKNILLSDSELAYNYLNKEYKELRFGDMEEFKKYIEKNKKVIEKIRLEKYEVDYSQDDFRYICMDQFENIYIFDEKDVLDYSVMLDIYTIDVPQFIETYDNANIQEKVLLNIEKIEQALNYGDYKYVYSKLAESFKKNKFETQNSFEEYIKNELYNNIKIEYKEFLNEGNTYIYNVDIKNLDNEADKKINMEIIMQLKEERDFVMSFSIK